MRCGIRCVNICVVVSFVSCIIQFCVLTDLSRVSVRVAPQRTLLVQCSIRQSRCVVSHMQKLTSFGSHQLFRLERGNDSRRNHIELEPET